MYSREKRVLPREYMEQGWSKSSLVEKLGVSRRTIYHWVTTGQLDRDLDDEKVVYRTRATVERKINCYTGIIHTRLEEYPKLSAVRLLEQQIRKPISGPFAARLFPDPTDNRRFSDSRSRTTAKSRDPENSKPANS